MSELLKHTGHRPFPLPSDPYVATQRWHDLLFAHWPVDAEDVRRALPLPLHPYLDLHDGRAWVGVIPFWMSNVAARWIPPLPGLSTFPELNVRTYLTIEGKPGVFFFSLDAGNLAAVMAARFIYSLPYFHARMAVWSDRHIGVHMPDAQPAYSSQVRYASERLEPPLPATFRAHYRPTAPASAPRPGSLEHFLVERYCLYTTRNRQILRVNIHHLPWPLQPAEAEIETNSMASSNGLVLPLDKAVLHFAKGLDVLVWWPKKVTI